MKLSHAKSWVNLVGATALVSTALFAVDIVKLRLAEHSPELTSIDALAVLLGLITLVCLAALVVTVTAMSALTLITKHSRYDKPLEQAIGLSNLLLPSVALTYVIVLEFMPSPRLGSAIMALGTSVILCLGLTRLPILSHLLRRYNTWSNRHTAWAALVHLICYLAIGLHVKPILNTLPSIAGTIQITLLSCLIGVSAHLLASQAKRLDYYGLVFIFALQLGCVAGLLTHPNQNVTQIVTIEHSSPTASSALKALRWADDADGDGFAPTYAGGDCNDSDPLIHPHAEEIAANGRDDNCMGGDAPAQQTSQLAKSPPRQPPEDTGRPSVVLIVVDTLRSDRVLYDGNGRNTTPNLSRWARSSARFLKAYAQAPHTPRSMPSLLTGKYPSRVAWVNSFENYPTPHRTERFLAEEFYDEGYATASVSSHWYFARVPEVLRGFERNRTLVQTYREQTDARQTTDTALRELSRFESQEDPFFFMVHYIDPHEPYSLKGKKAVFGSRRLIDRYDSEVHFMDRHIGRLLNYLTQLQSKEDVFVIVTSDHGESFREHGLLFHGRTLYNEEIQVPLLINGPNVASGDIVKPVGLVDVAPTIRALAGLPPSPSDGINLLSMIDAPNKERAGHLYSEILPYPRYNQHRLAAISADGRWKLIRNLTRHTIELFDLERDPREKKNQFSPSHPAAGSLKRELERFVDGRESGESNSRTVDQGRDGTPLRVRQTPEPVIHRRHL